MFCVTLQQSLRLGPYQTQTTDVSLSDEVTLIQCKLVCCLLLMTL